jgi:N-acetyl-anhydromuramyl-L-alanine amidase AmpD
MPSPTGNADRTLIAVDSEALRSKMAKKRTVRRPYEVVHMNVRNQSSRSGPIRAIVLHDTESKDYPGASDLRAIGNWFDNPQAAASAHVCVDGEGHSAQYVPDARKAWHCASYNSATLGIEQIGYATFTQAVWSRNHRAQLRKVAQYIAYWSKKYDIPIRKGRGVNGVITKKGIVTHRSLGAAGGGHHDPGLGYPQRAVFALARYYRARGW